LTNTINTETNDFIKTNLRIREDAIKEFYRYLSINPTQGKQMGEWRSGSDSTLNKITDYFWHGGELKIEFEIRLNRKEESYTFTVIKHWLKEIKEETRKKEVDRIE